MRRFSSCARLLSSAPTVRQIKNTTNIKDAITVYRISKQTDSHVFNTLIGLGFKLRTVEPLLPLADDIIANKIKDCFTIRSMIEVCLRCNNSKYTPKLWRAAADAKLV
jgi:hypothetical protein